MRVVFRADASAAVGGGHVMRCAALAAQLQQRGAEVFLLSRGLPEPYRRMLADQGCRVLPLPAGGREPLALADEIDEACAALAAHAPWDWLIVDHYGLGREWERAMRRFVGKLLLIDDYTDRDHDGDVLLNQNLHADADAYRGRLSPSCVILTGPRYALVRAEFAAARAALRRRDGSVGRLLVCFGGADADDLTGRTVDAFIAADLQGVWGDVVVGPSYGHWEKLAARCTGSPRLGLSRDVTDMAERMAAADLFIGGGGSMTWERATLGLAGFTVALADNQQPVCAALEERGAGIHLGGAGSVAVQDMVDALRFGVRHPGLLRALGEAIAVLSDGRGALRVARLLLPAQVSLRSAQADDCAAIFAWRNDERTRRYFFDPSPLDFAAHSTWFAATLASADSRLLIGMNAGTSCGVIRFDRRGERTRMSVYLDPSRHGEGLGAALIRAGLAWLRQREDFPRLVCAEILGDNAASLAAFAAAGFHECGRQWQVETGLGEDVEGAS